MGIFSPIPRRTFLRSLSATIALPCLEAMLPSSSLLAARISENGTPSGTPLRLGFFFAPNGVHMPDWKPTETGTDYKITKALSPLTPFRKDILVLSGLALDKAAANGDGPGDHARSSATFLTGTQAFKTNGAGIRAGTSVDQIAAKQIGNQTRIPSLELGLEAGPRAGTCDSGYSCAYSTSISWHSPTSPAGKEVRPANIFARLFGNPNNTVQAGSLDRLHRQNKSILDHVLEETRQLSTKISKQDHAKIDEYLTGVRELERRLNLPEEELAQITSSSGDLPRLPAKTPKKFSTHMRLLGDLMVYAFQTDTTRVCTFMLGNAGSQRVYRDLKINEGHHSISHHQNNPKQIAKISNIIRYQMEQFAYIIKRLKETPEGNSNLLENSMILYGSAIGDGNRHNHNNLPILLAGQGGGKINSGRHLQYKDSLPLMNLYMTMLQTAGVSVETIGDSTGRLENILA